MADTLSPDDVRRRNQAAMGEELGELYTVLSNDLTWLHWRWSQYVQLFADKPERLEVLNSTAPFFFFVVQRTLWYDTLLGLTLLTAPVKTMNKDNLTIRRLPALVADSKLQAEVEDLITKAVGATEFATDWRNREIAHRDLALALGHEAAKPLAPATREKVEEALDSIAAALNHLDLHFLGATTYFRYSGGSRGAEDLLYVLRDGLRREQLRQEKLQSGEYDPKDWNDDVGAV